MTQLEAATKVISVVTAAELRFGALRARWGDRRLHELEVVISTYVSIAVDDEIARLWAGLREACRGTGVTPGANDLWIAATAVRPNCPVATLDNDFSRMPGVRVISESGLEGQMSMP